MTGGLEIIVLLAVAVVLIMRLISVLGRRDGFEPENRPVERPRPANDLKLVKSEPSEDLDAEHYGEDREMKAAIEQAKAIEPDFSVNDFLAGSKVAYEQILMAFMNDNMDPVSPFIDETVLAGFNHALAEREKAGEKIEAHFVGIKDLKLSTASFDKGSKELTLGVDYTAELTRIVRNKDGKIIQGGKNKVETEVDHWQYARVMGSPDPNWTLVATGE